MLMKNAFYFMLKALFVFKIFAFFSDFLVYVEKWLDKKAKFCFKNYDVTGETTKNYNTQISQYCKKWTMKNVHITLEFSSSKIMKE